MKRIVRIILITIISFILAGCNQEEIIYITEIENIKIDDIYNMEEDEYYIFFYKNDCIYCDEVKPYINEYVKLEEKTAIYGVTYSDKDNLLIARKYTGIGGQGKNNEYFVDGVANYFDLYVPKVPSLIKISIENDVKQSQFIASGRSETIAYFENELHVVLEIDNQNN